MAGAQRWMSPKPAPWASSLHGGSGTAEGEHSTSSPLSTTAGHLQKLGRKEPSILLRDRQRPTSFQPNCAREHPLQNYFFGGNLVCLIKFLQERSWRIIIRTPAHLLNVPTHSEAILIFQSSWKSLKTLPCFSQWWFIYFNFNNESAYFKPSLVSKNTTQLRCNCCSHKPNHPAN